MRKKLVKKYKKFIFLKKKKSLLGKFFNSFLPEVVYRSTKIEHPKALRKEIISFLK